MHADASSFRQAVMVYPSSRKKIASPQELTSTNSCRVNTHFHHCSELLVSVFETNQSRTLLQASTDTPILDLRFSSRSAHDPSHQPNQFRQLFSGPNQFQMHVSRALNVAQNSFHTSHVTLGRRGTRHCQRLYRIMQVETVSTDRYISASEQRIQLLCGFTFLRNCFFCLLLRYSPQPTLSDSESVERALHTILKLLRRY